MSEYKILTINPGSTSTKIAVFEGETVLFSTNVSHDADELAKVHTIICYVERGKPYALRSFSR